MINLKNVVEFVKNSVEDLEMWVNYNGKNERLNNDFYIINSQIYYLQGEYDYPATIDEFLHDLEEEAKDEVWNTDIYKSAMDSLCECDMFVTESPETCEKESYRVYKIEFKGDKVVLYAKEENKLLLKQYQEMEDYKRLHYSIDVYVGQDAIGSYYPLEYDLNTNTIILVRDINKYDFLFMDLTNYRELYSYNGQPILVLTKRYTDIECLAYLLVFANNHKEGTLSRQVMKVYADTKGYTLEKAMTDICKKYTKDTINKVFSDKVYKYILDIGYDMTIKDSTTKMDIMTIANNIIEEVI